MDGILLFFFFFRLVLSIPVVGIIFSIGFFPSDRARYIVDYYWPEGDPSGYAANPI